MTRLLVHQINQLMNLIDTNNTVAILCVVGIVFVGIVLPTLLKLKRRER